MRCGYLFKLIHYTAHTHSPTINKLIGTQSGDL